MSIFRSTEGHGRILAWHHHFRARLPQLESRRVETRFGETHVLLGGPSGGPPLVLLHGALASSAHVLAELPALLDTHRVHAVDIVGQSVMSAETRPDVRGDDYGRWLLDTMDALGLERPHLVGVSWGGFVAQRLAAVAPDRIGRLVLLVPAGVVSGPAWAGFWRLGLPITLYRAFPSERRLHSFIPHLVSTPEDEDWVGFLGDAFLHYRLDMRIPRHTKPGELDRLEAPALVIAAEDDLSFPGGPLLARAAEILPSLAETELLEGSRHCPPTTDAFRQWLGPRIQRFLDEARPERARTAV